MQTTVEAKAWYKSWTIWLGIISLVAAFLDGILQMNILPSGAAETVAGVLGFLHIILRFKTDKPVALKAGTFKSVGERSAGW